MSEHAEFLLRTLMIGVGATATMDVWAVVLRRLGVPSLDFALLGRWVGHLPRGRFVHESIARSAPVPGERALGWGLHYAIGLTFAALTTAVFGLSWARAPSLGPALLVGLVTVVAPLLVLQPALGAGVLSSKTPRPVFNSVKSLATHTVYGVGLYLAALATALVIPEGSVVLP
jgi:hypothetical protein